MTFLVINWTGCDLIFRTDTSLTNFHINGQDVGQVDEEDIQRGNSGMIQIFFDVKNE